jgi:putative membrane protein
MIQGPNHGNGGVQMRRVPVFLYLSVVAGVPLLPFAAHATVSEGDRQFLIKAGQANVNEIKLSHLATRKASRPDVKAFAEKMVSDHTMLEKKLRPFAMAWSVNLPAEPDADHQAEYRKLRKLSGADFDKEYINVMEKDHNQVLEAFTHEADVASDPDFKFTVISEKSVIAAHTNMADDLKGKLSSR